MGTDLILPVGKNTILTAQIKTIQKNIWRLKSTFIMCIFLAAHLESFAQILKRYQKNRLKDSLYLNFGFKTRIADLWQIIIKDIPTNSCDLRQTWALRTRGYQLHPNFKGRIFFIFPLRIFSRAARHD